ncbi:hypothetical protein [Spirillospora sp. CA-294931]|uniref:hypothetical protein n=1 Tax=Spirillospora sp. CA-294931 TaxID=3240042 RepID=UPI003D911066
MTLRFRAAAGTAAIAGMAALAFVAPMSANATDTKPKGSYHATVLDEGSASLSGDQSKKTGKKAPRVGKEQRTVKRMAAWYYNIDSSCDGYESSIREGGDYWGGTESSSGGTPVSCVGDYIQNCGSGTVIGCNWNSGGEIQLSKRWDGDFALLAAHEFGHNWYDHSPEGCASWESAYEVMRPKLCS